MEVRFIAITDNYDNANEIGDADQIVIPFKNLINDAYCRDMSIKIRSHLDVKRKNGKFIGSFAGYGYQKDPVDHNHLVIDEYAAGIVRMIFSMKLEGSSSGRIAQKLNESGCADTDGVQTSLWNEFQQRLSGQPSPGLDSKLRDTNSEK